MAGFENEMQEHSVEEKDSELTETKGREKDELEEITETEDLEGDFKRGIDPALDSVEIDVEEILSEIASEAKTGDTASIRIRKRLEAMMERKRRHEDTIDFDEYDLDS